MQEDKIELKNLKAIIRKEKLVFEKKKIKNDFENCEGDSQKMWKMTKKHLFGKQNENPERILENGNILTGAKKVSNALNRF